MEERLQKYMARCGVDSRRKCEELIARGLVEVNGEVVREPGVKIDPRRDRVMVDGKRLRLEQPAHYIHYKVKGVTTTVSDDLGRRTVMDCLPNIRERVYPVGRLDKESEGLLILTNDGELANYLTHPAHGVEKTYRVVAEGRIEQDTIDALAEKGMRLGPVLVKPSRVELVRYDNDNTIVLISVSEGINREVRRIFAALGHEVKRLLRIQVGPIGLIGMKRGATRPMTDRELSLLRKGMESMDPDQEASLFPSGSARERRPKGPRGRTRAPRQGKPDPAAHAGRKKGSVVDDDWEKKTGPGRKARGDKSASAKPAAKAGSRGNDRTEAPKRGKSQRPEKPDRKTAAKAGPRKDDGAEAPKRLKTLRPEKPGKKAAPKPRPPAKPAKPKIAAHPLLGKKKSGGKPQKTERGK